ncbi:MAG TPA: sulfur carrier protein ThiS [Thermoanaerobaculia bacterium]|jgi:sulfur carrier protein|nr:sulfur carrier protein ThiS [Thermoanaerobaculia bacterium]
MTDAALGATLRLEVNGRARETPPGISVAGLVAELAGESRFVAVERNGEIVPRSRWSATELADGDRVEIVRFVQGG